MSVSRLISKGSTMGDTKYKVNINKNGFILNLDAIKVNNERTLSTLRLIDILHKSHHLKRQISI